MRRKDVQIGKYCGFYRHIDKYWKVDSDLFRIIEMPNSNSEMVKCQIIASSYICYFCYFEEYPTIFIPYKHLIELNHTMDFLNWHIGDKLKVNALGNKRSLHYKDAIYKITNIKLNSNKEIYIYAKKDGSYRDIVIPPVYFERILSC